MITTFEQTNPPSPAGRTPWAGLPAPVVGAEQWPITIDADTWQRLFGRPPHGVFVIVDEQVGKSHGQLRSLPLLRALGLTRFTFANGWRGFELVPYEWYRLAVDSDWEGIDGLVPICQVISQEMEDRSPGDIAYALLQAYRRAGPESLLVYVVDSARFSRARDPQARSFVDEHELPMPIEYERLAERFVRMRQIAVGQPLISFNIAWHGLAAFRRAEGPARHLAELLDFTNHIAASPLWDLYAALCRLGGDDADCRVRKPRLPLFRGSGTVRTACTEVSYAAHEGTAAQRSTGRGSRTRQVPDRPAAPAIT